METITLLTTGDVANPALEIMHRMEREVLARPGWVEVVNPVSARRNERVAAIVRALGLREAARRVLTLGLKLKRLTTKVGPEAQTSSRDLFVILVDSKLISPHSASLLGSSGKKAALIFDAWPSTYDFAVEMFHTYGFDHFFFTSRDVAAAMSRRLPPGACSWLAEGLAPAKFRSCPDAERDIDVVELGRKYDRYHDAIAPGCEAAGIRHLFEKRAGEIIFPTTEALLDGLSRARISICFPRSITHPHIAGGISMVTQRYLESMLSKCLILGTAPDEMKDLFPYRPVVEVDWKDPFGQVQEILANFGSYQLLIDRNHRFVTENHLWANRIPAIEKYFRAGS